MNTAHVSHHAVHCHIARHHRFQGALLFNGYRERHHQFPGARVHIGCSHYRAISADDLLIPRAKGGIVISGHPGWVRKFSRFAGITHVDVGESTRQRKLFKHRNRIVAERDRLRRSDDGHFAVHPVGNRHVVAGAGAGQNIALRLLIILARDLKVNNGIKKKGDDQTACRRGNDAGANGSEHKCNTCCVVSMPIGNGAGKLDAETASIRK